MIFFYLYWWYSDRHINVPQQNKVSVTHLGASLGPRLTHLWREKPGHNIRHRVKSQKCWARKHWSDLFRPRYDTFWPITRLVSYTENRFVKHQRHSLERYCHTIPAMHSTAHYCDHLPHSQTNGLDNSNLCTGHNHWNLLWIGQF